MRMAMLGLTSAVALAAAPAFAQSSNQSGQQGKSASGQQSQQIQAMNQEKLRSNLEKAGFSNVTVLDAAYLVQADTSDGNQVMMLINPPSGGSGSQASAGSSSAVPAAASSSRPRATDDLGFPGRVPPHPSGLRLFRHCSADLEFTR